MKFCWRWSHRVKLLVIVSVAAWSLTLLIGCRLGHFVWLLHVMWMQQDEYPRSTETERNECVCSEQRQTIFYGPIFFVWSSVGFPSRENMPSAAHYTLTSIFRLNTIKHFTRPMGAHICSHCRRRTQSVIFVTNRRAHAPTRNNHFQHKNKYEKRNFLDRRIDTFRWSKCSLHSCASISTEFDFVERRGASTFHCHCWRRRRRHHHGHLSVRA